MKNEKDLLKFLIKFWGGFIFIVASAFFANQAANLQQVEKYMGIFNIIYFVIIAIYGFAAASISLKNNKPTNCTLTIFSGALVILFLAIADILWYNIDQVTVTWLDLIFTVLEFCIGIYIGLTIFILNNLKIVNLKKNEELKKAREVKKLAYENERRVREEDRRVREEDRRKILNGLANIDVDRRVGPKDRRVNPDRRKKNQTKKDFKDNVAKRTADMVGLLTTTLDKLDDEINELDEEMRIADDKISCLEDEPICVDISNNDNIIADNQIVVDDDTTINNELVDIFNDNDKKDEK